MTRHLISLVAINTGPNFCANNTLWGFYNKRHLIMGQFEDRSWAWSWWSKLTSVENQKALGYFLCSNVFIKLYYFWKNQNLLFDNWANKRLANLEFPASAAAWRAVHPNGCFEFTSIPVSSSLDMNWIL